MKKLLVCFILLATAVSAFAQTYPKYTGYVNDYTNTLSAATRDSLNNDLASFSRKTSVEVAVVIVPSLEGQGPEEYAKGIANFWHVGKAGKNNGIIFLVAINDRKIRIETGEGIKPVLTDDKAMDIVRNVITPPLHEGNFDKGITDGVQAIMQAASPDSSAQAAAVPDDVQLPSLAVVLTIVGIVAALILLAIILVPYYFRMSAKKELLETLGSFTACVKETVPLTQHADVKRDSGADLKDLEKRFQNFAFLTKHSSGIDWVKENDKLNGLYENLCGMQQGLRNQINRANTARTKGPELLQSLPDQFDKAEKELHEEKASKAAFNRLQKAREKYSQAQTMYSTSNNSTMLNWVVLYALLVDSQDHCEGALDYDSEYGSRSSSSNYSGGFSDGSTFGGGSMGAGSGGATGSF